MYVTYQNARVGVRDESNQIVWLNVGDYKLILKSNETDLSKRNRLHDMALRSMISSAKLVRRERGTQVIYLDSKVEGWSRVLNTAAKHGHGLTFTQYSALAFVVQTGAVVLEGRQAFDLLRWLWTMTPEANCQRAVVLLQPTNDELRQIKFIKEIGNDGQEIIRLIVPEGRIAACFIGRKGVNIKHLQEVLDAAGTRVSLETIKSPLNRASSARQQLFSLNASA